LDLIGKKVGRESQLPSVGRGRGHARKRRAGMGGGFYELTLKKKKILVETRDIASIVPATSPSRTFEENVPAGERGDDPKTPRD